jgi:hypothetical protein
MALDFNDAIWIFIFLASYDALRSLTEYERSNELHSLENAFNDTKFRHSLLLLPFLPPSGSLMHFLGDCNS